MLTVCAWAAVDVVEKGQYITLRNAKIDMYKGSMRLAVNQWGKVEAAEKQNFEAKVGARVLWGLVIPHNMLDNATTVSTFSM